ncbi:MAG: WYL domain-containing protein [Phycisphaerales bacterium]
MARTTSKGMTSIAMEILRKAAGADPPTVSWVREHFGVTERQAFRYINHAKEAGIELVAERQPDGRTVYRLPGTAYFRPEQLSVPEAIATAVLMHALLGQPLQPDSGTAKGGVEKIRRALDKQVEQRVRHLQDRLSVRMVQAERPTQPKVFHTLVEAILADVTVTAAYESPYGAGGAAARGTAAGAATRGAAAGTAADTARSGKAKRLETVELEPFALVFARRSWYLVARKVQTSEVRLYKLARFKHVAVTSRRFVMPKGFTVDDHLGDAWELVRGTGAQATSVELVFDPEFATVISDTRWHRSQRLSVLPDGSLRFQARVAGTQEILWWVLGMGSHVRVVSPPELVKAVREETARMARVHGVSASSWRAGRGREARKRKG